MKKPPPAAALARRVSHRQVACFLEIAARGAFAGAAEALATTQPAVSKTVSELEATLGARLFERGRHGARLTPEGEAFLRHAQLSATALREGVEALRRSASAPPRISIGALPTVAGSVAPAAIFRARAAGLRAPISLVTGGNDLLLQMLKDKKLDLVVGRFADIAAMRDLAFERLYSESLVVAARAGHPLGARKRSPLKAILDYPLLLPERGSIIRPMVDTLLNSRGLAPPEDVIETTSPSFGRAYLRISEAIWIISRGVVADDLAAGDLVALPVEVDVVAGPVGITSRTDAVVSPSIDALRRAFREAAAQIGFSPPET